MVKSALPLAFSVVFIVTPFLAFAASCPSDYKEYTVGSIAAAQSKLKEMVINTPDKCSDESIIIIKNTLSGSVCHKETRRCTTAADRSKYGCNPGQTKPTITAKLPPDFGSKNITITKCDTSSLISAIDQSFKEESAAPLEKLAATQTIGSFVPSGQTLSSGDVIQRALAGTGASPAQIQQITQNPDLLAALAKGDNAEIQRVAQAAGLTSAQASRLADAQAQLTAAVTQRGPTAAENLARLAGLQTLGSGQTGWGAQQTAQGASSPFDCSTGGSGSGGMGNIGSLAGALGPLANALMNGNSPLGMGLGKEEKKEPSQTTKSEAVATLALQSTTAKRGDSVTISWSTLGMSSDVSCRLFVASENGTTQLGEGNEGTRTLKIQNDETSLSFVVTLKCRAGGGEQIEKTAWITIQ